MNALLSMARHGLRLGLIGLGAASLLVGGPSGTGRAQQVGQTAGTVDISTQRGTNPIFRVDEQVELVIRVSQDMDVACYYRQADGRIIQIFPNRFRPEATVLSSQQIRIPGEEIRFAVVPASPDVIETVHCFGLPEGGFATLPGQAKADFTEPLSYGSFGRLRAEVRQAVTGGVSEAVLSFIVLSP